MTTYSVLRTPLALEERIRAAFPTPVKVFHDSVHAFRVFETSGPLVVFEDDTVFVESFEVMSDCVEFIFADSDEGLVEVSAS